MGHKVYIVVEKPSELEMVAGRRSARLNIKPNIGCAPSGVHRLPACRNRAAVPMSKFGLSASRILALVERLRSLGKLDCPATVHFHLGSPDRQHPATSRAASRSAAATAERAVPSGRRSGGGRGRPGCGLRGHPFPEPLLPNYSLSQYANNVVWGIGDVCRGFDLPHPTIIPAGRPCHCCTPRRAGHQYHWCRRVEVNDISAPDEDAPTILQNMWKGWLDRAGITPAGDLPRLRGDLGDVNAQSTMGLSAPGTTAPGRMLRGTPVWRSREQQDPVQPLAPTAPWPCRLSEKLADKCFANFSCSRSCRMPRGIGPGRIPSDAPLAVASIVCSGTAAASDGRRLLTPTVGWARRRRMLGWKACLPMPVCGGPREEFATSADHPGGCLSGRITGICTALLPADAAVWLDEEARWTSAT